MSGLQERSFCSLFRPISLDSHLNLRKFRQQLFATQRMQLAWHSQMFKLSRHGSHQNTLPVSDTVLFKTCDAWSQHP